MKKNHLETHKYQKARERVKAMKGFYNHCTVYCIVIPILIFINLKFEPHFHWFWFSLIGWGIGLFTHWLKVFGFHKMGFGNHWEENKIKEIMAAQSNEKD